MTILTKTEILKEIKKGRVKIEPMSQDQIGPASVDLCLGNEFRVFKKWKTAPISENVDYKKFTELVNVDKYKILGPDEFVLGITKEKITLPDNICGWLTGRSRFARLGLSIHITASFIQPGISNRQVLEIKNVSKIPLILYPGTRICQIILISASGKGKYQGAFAKQDSL
ncbi:dCTP deaminase [Candidatus Woesearchaeota archaeon]|nr:dCTP deaminase [Candidatus Woesearchaeota archaeon]